MLKDRPIIEYCGARIPSFATINETARAGIMPETALRRMRACGELPGILVGTRFYINTARLLEMLDAQSAAQPAQTAQPIRV